MIWHVVTGEYPPACGGVGDYTAALADALAASGDDVTIWTPGRTLPDRFGRGSRRVLAEAFAKTPGVVLVQYVPSVFGVRGMNLPFCLWLRRLAAQGADVRVMFHEPYFYYSFARPWRNVLAAAQRIMALVLLKAARIVYVSTETWRRYLEPLATLPPMHVLPIPSTIPGTAWPQAVDAYRAEMASNGGPVVGHFGTYGAHVETELSRLLPSIAAAVPDARFAFTGAGSREFLTRLRTSCPDVAARSWASGRLDPPAMAAALRACNVLIQPYPDGITTRRTSAMAGLRNAVATVSTRGALTEPVWIESGAVALAPVGDVDAFSSTVASLLRDPVARVALSRRGAETYAERFSVERTIAVLRDASAVS